MEKNTKGGPLNVRKTAKKKFRLSTTQVILFSFLITILIGSVLLALPISTSDGNGISYVDALFTATTSTCVTGLVTQTTASAFSTFGHVVILLLIQIGGLGVITIMSGFMIMLHHKMGISDRILVQDAFNLNTMAGLSRFVRNILFGTFMIEGIGALLYMTVFVPDFGVRGIWISVFTSVSAFCNAGIDIIGENSLCDYATHPLINLVTSLLIVLGGIGYVVWWDVIRVLRSRNARNRRVFRHLSLHSKIAIVSTLCLIFGGAFLILLFEYDNPLTIGRLSVFDKIQVSIFQSVTTRTAGFMTVPQQNLTTASSILSLILMFIGGSPVGTAGGVKTVTVVVLLSSAFATIRNKREASIFHRAISIFSIRKAVAVVITFSLIMLSSILFLAVFTEASVIDVLYESVSATATVGLSRGITPNLNTFGKFVVIATMYLGRVGPISLAVALGQRGETQNVVSEPEEEISIG